METNCKTLLNQSSLLLMDFSLTKEQEMIQKTVREFAEKEVKPIAEQIDKENRFPAENVKKMGQLGLLALTIPNEYGGNLVDGISYAIAIEELARVCASTSIIMAVHNSLATTPLLKYGTDEQKKKFLPRLAKGELGAFALTEPNAGTDAGNQQTTAKLDGDDYVLNGTKIFITSGSQAQFINVFASTDKTKGAKGISCFLIEKGTKGFSIGTIEDKLGIRASETAELVFEDCRIPKENLIGKEGDGFKIAMQTLDYGRIGVGAQAVGIAQGCLDECLKYAKQREQFGKPIASFQAIQFMLSDMATEIDGARFLVYKAAWLKDKNVRLSKEAAMAKLYASETAMKCAVKAVQIHGGYGYIKSYVVERFFRDAKITEIYEGTSEVQRMVIASNILR